jgi:hypothetical protein
VYKVKMVLVLVLKRLSAGLGKRPADSRFKSKRSTIATLYTWPPDDGLKIVQNM